MKKEFWLFLLFFCTSAIAIQPSPLNLKVNYLTNPLGIDDRVFFSWEMNNADRNIMQSAWQILVSSESEIIASDETWKTSEGPVVRNNILWLYDCK